MTPLKKKKRQITKQEKLLIFIAFIGILLLSFIISALTKTEVIPPINESENSEYQIRDHKGSAVRKETDLRKDYEETYRQKDENWDDRYSKILENKEDDKRLPNLQLTDTNKTKP